MIKETVNGLERIIKFRPGFHKIAEDPKKNYGVHGMDMFFVVKGPKGAVHFILSTGMMLKKTRDWQREEHKDGIGYLFPMGVDVGYHSTTPGHEGQEVYWPTKMKQKDPTMKSPGPDATQDERLAYLENTEFVKVGDKAPDCEWIGQPCYTDGSALRAMEWEEIFTEHGDEKIWAMLEEEYKDRFEEPQS